MSYRVLVTGCAGFIGSHVAQHCADLGMEVIGVDDLSGGREENLTEQYRQGLQTWIGDVSFPPHVERCWKDFGPFDAVYHLAAYAAEGLSHFIRGYNYTNNLIGTTNIINECVKQGQRTGKLPHLVFTSSIASYGHPKPKGVPVTEDTPQNPCDPYGVAKLACELDIKAAHEMWGLNYTIFRPYNVYGERQNLNDPYRNVVGIFMRQAMTGQPFTIFGDGKQERAFSYIDDVAPIIAKAPGVKGALNQTFNVGGEVSFTVNELAREIADVFGIPLEVQYLAARNEVQQVYASPAKVRSVFCPPPLTPLREGLESMAQWAKTQTIEPPKPFANLEVDWNLPPSWKALVNP